MQHSERDPEREFKASLTDRATMWLERTAAGCKRGGATCGRVHCGEETEPRVARQRHRVAPLGQLHASGGTFGQRRYALQSLRRRKVYLPARTASRDSTANSQAHYVHSLSIGARLSS